MVFVLRVRVLNWRDMNSVLKTFQGDLQCWSVMSVWKEGGCPTGLMGRGMSCAPWDGNGPHNQLGLRITAALWVPLQSHPQTEGFSRAGLRSTRLKEKEKKNKLETESRWIYMICLRAVIKLRRPETEKHEWAFRCITSCLFCTDKWVRCFLVIWNWELWLVSIVGLREQLRV